MGKVINTHHYGGVEKLPPTAFYIGRPGEYGNPFSSKSGRYTREQAVAYHRVYLYREIIKDKTLLSHIRKDLENKDLACWCAQDKKIVACHGDNFIHIFNPKFNDRQYDKSVLFYLMDDLRRVIHTLREWVRVEVTQSDYIDYYLALGDTRLEIDTMMFIFKLKEYDATQACEYIAQVVIELELAVRESDNQMRAWRLDHVLWRIRTLIYVEGTAGTEPVSPNVAIKRIKKRKL